MLSVMQKRLREEYDIENAECIDEENNIVVIISDIDLFYSYNGDMYSYGVVNSSIYKNYFTVEDVIEDMDWEN